MPSSTSCRVADPGRSALLAGLLVALLAVCMCACATEPPPNGSYFSERLQPALTIGCVQQTTGCHLARDGTASGNLDLTSYDSLMRRRDLLPRFGPYPFGSLLMKVSPPVDITVNTADPPDPARPDVRSVLIRTDIRHAAGSGIALDSTGFAHLRQWIDSGFARTGVPEDLPPNVAPGECVSGGGINDFEVNRFETSGPVDDPTSYDRFITQVQPVLRANCSGSNCHGNKLRSLYLTCGDTEDEKRWNFFAATWHLASPVSSSEILRRPLARDRGGDYHVGGDVFATPDDAGYVAIRDWAEDLVTRVPSVLVEDYATDGFRYFVNRVQPMLVRKGCMLQNCHSHVSQNQELQLFVGSQGYFSRAAQHRNHGAGLGVLALESPDPNVSRVIAKNLFPPEQFPGGQGIAHRGGSLLEDFGGVPASFDRCASYDLENGDLNEIPAYCILARWQQVERAVAIAAGRVQTTPISSVVWVSRPLGIGPATDFDTYRPGADLHMSRPTLGADGSIALDAPTSLLAGCGLDRATADIRSPAAAWDGTRIAFAARSSAADPLRLYWMNDDGSDCEQIPGVAAPTTSENGILTHDFDPSFAPTGQLVFASTRGNVDRANYDYAGPTRTPAAMEPNANLYVFSALATPPVRQLTFMLEQELSPTFTNVGRVVYMGEKREPGFHQLSLRQQDLDGGDFRPAFGARNSMGFESLTEPVQLHTHDLAFVAGPLGAVDGAGTILIANQSLGVDDSARSPADRNYLRPLRHPVSSVLEGGRGVYRSPAALPGYKLLVSCDLAATSLSGPFDFELCELDPSTGIVRVVAGEAGRSDIEAVAVYSHYVLSTEAVLPSDGERLDRPTIVEGRPNALVTFHDFQIQMGLLFSNVRGPRIVDGRITGFDVLEELPPPAGATTFADVADRVVADELGGMYVRRRLLGHVELLADYSAYVEIPAGTPILWRPTGSDGQPLSFGADSPFAGVPMIPREADQYYPGEHSRRSFPRRIFNNVCGWCHAGMSGRELDVSVSPDVLTTASMSNAVNTEAIDLAVPPAERAAPEPL